MEDYLYYDFKVNKDLIYSFMELNNLTIHQFCEKADISLKVFIGIMMFDCGCDMINLEKLATFMNLKFNDVLIN